MKLSRGGAAALDRWLRGAPTNETETSAQRSLRERLIERGLAHPTPTPAADLGSVAVVVPVLDDLDGLGLLLASLRAGLANQPIVIVDDGSTNHSGVAELAAESNALVIRHESNEGPGAARNTGWRHLAASANPPDTVVFIDADVVANPDAVALLVAHLYADPGLGIVAPRVAPRSASGSLYAYEAHNSPLDMGVEPALVAPKTRVSYVPSAALAVRLDVLVALDGFDERLRLGEDVDFVWRAIEAGWTVRYDARAIVEHRSRTTLQAMMRQRYLYGTSSSRLETRHNNYVFPVELSATQLAIWGAWLIGGPVGQVLSAAGVAASVSHLSGKLEPSVDEPTPLAARLIADSHRFGLFWLANATTRAWAPLALFTRPTRRLYALALVVPAVIDWWPARRTIDPIRFIGYRAADHGAYCAGLWTGAWRERSARALLPRLRWR